MQTMKIAVGTHVNGGPTFNELASQEVRVVRANAKSAENGQPIHTLRSIGVMSVIADAADAHFNTGIKGQEIFVEEDASDLIEIAKKLRRTASQLVAKAKTIGDAE